MLLYGRIMQILITNKFSHIIAIATLAIASCTGKSSNRNADSLSKNEFLDLYRLSNLSNVICNRIEEGTVKRIAIKPRVYEMLNQSEKEIIEECLILKRVIVDTSRTRVSRNSYIYDSTIYFDFRIISHEGSQYLSAWYPLGFGMDCGTGTLFEKYELIKTDSKLVVGEKIEDNF